MDHRIRRLLGYLSNGHFTYAFWPLIHRCPGRHNPKTFDLISVGPDGIESKEDVCNWEEAE